MSRISFTNPKRTTQEQRADVLFSLRVQVEQAIRKAQGSDDRIYRNGLLSILETLDNLHHKVSFPALTKRKPNKNLKPVG